MRRRVLLPLVALAPLVVAVAACSAGSASQPPASSGPPGSAGSGLPPELEAGVVADAARRASVAADAVTIVEARAVTWSDGSLGCPEPGQFYTQALVEGYRILVQAGGRQLDYRAGRNGQFKLCENPSGAPGGGVDDY